MCRRLHLIVAALLPHARALRAPYFLAGFYHRHLCCVHGCVYSSCVFHVDSVSCPEQLMPTSMRRAYPN